MSGIANLTVTIRDEAEVILWSYQDGISANGLTSMTYLTDGTQQRIIDALLAALIEARGQLRRATLNVTNVIPYVRPTTAEIDHSIPIV